MKKLLSTGLFSVLFVVVLFVLFGDNEKQVENQLTSVNSRWQYIAYSTAALVSDILLPIPSSLVMILNGKMLGVLLGSIVSIVSGIISSSIGFYIGRFSRTLIRRFFSEEDRKAGDRMFEQFGNLAIVISKSLPVLSEVVSFISGTTSMGFGRFLLYSATGQLIISVLYAIVGYYVSIQDSTFITIMIVFVSMAIGWIAQKFIVAKK